MKQNSNRNSQASLCTSSWAAKVLTFERVLRNNLKEKASLQMLVWNLLATEETVLVFNSCPCMRESNILK